MLHRQRAGLDGFECSSGDMLRYDTGYAVREEETNAFAACLLMPAQDFRYQMENERFSFDLLNHCTERYGVSLTSTVLRWLEFTPQRAIAVFSEDGYMHWAKSGDKAYKSGKYFATRSGPIPVPAGS
jgi:Zn-dependent peptidase ImmA (M78 family)